MLEQIASADAVLTQSERNLGVGIIDIGGGTSDFALYKDSKIRHSKVVPVAGNHLTNDLAIGLAIPIKEAEELKRFYGFVMEDKYFEYNVDKVRVNLGYDNISKEVDIYSIYEVLNVRAQEVFDLIEEARQVSSPIRSASSSGPIGWLVPSFIAVSISVTPPTPS